MIIVAGHLALIAAIFTSFALALSPVFPRRWKGRGAVYAVCTLFFLITVSFAALMHAYAVSDFSVWNVVQNSHSAMPLIYKLTGVWGNHEGSILLWVWILSLWGLLVALSHQALPPGLKTKTLAFLGMIAFGFLLFIFFASNPFLRASPPALEGLGLNPVLQDIALAVHPPMLYTGYVGFSVAFCFALAALIEGRIDQAWASAVRPWILAAWVALTAGIVKGSVWAYYELGWGGFWFWDPVENASLMPWLSGTALLHSVVVLEKRNSLKSWTIFLSILAFTFSLLGTFLVRSGVLTSVHAFAVDPLRGLFILALLVVAIGGGFLLYAMRAHAIRPGPGLRPVSRETFLLLNNVFLFTACLSVFLGTVYPIILNALDLGSVSVGAPYYSSVLLPMLVPFSFLMAAAPFVMWRQDRVETAARKMALPFAAAVAVVVLLPVKTLALVAGVGCGVLILAATTLDVWRKTGRFMKIKSMPLSYHGMAVAHAGFALMLMGAVVATGLSEEKILWVAPGDAVTLAGKDVQFFGVKPGEGPNYQRLSGFFAVRDGAASFYMTPEKRWYPAAQKMTSEVALHIGFLDIFYLVLGDEDKKQPGRFVVRMYRHPLVMLVFGGGALIALGGLLSLLDGRRRRHA